MCGGEGSRETQSSEAKSTVCTEQSWGIGLKTTPYSPVFIEFGNKREIKSKWYQNGGQGVKKCR